MFKKVYSLYSAFCTQPAFYSQSAVCILHSVCILPLVCSLQSAVHSLRFTLTVSQINFHQRGTNSTTTNYTGTANFNSNKDYCQHFLLKDVLKVLS